MRRTTRIAATGLLLFLGGCTADAVAPKPDRDPAPQLGTEHAAGYPIELRPLPGDVEARARGVNASGSVVGHSGDRPVVWKEGAPIPLDMPPGYLAASGSHINEAGQVAGSAVIEETGRTHAVHWDEDGSLVDLGTLPGHEYSGVTDLGEGGRIVGFSRAEGGPRPGDRGVLWYEGQMTELRPLPGHDVSFATQVGGSGLVLGVSYDWGIEDYQFVAWRDGEIAYSRGPDPFSRTAIELTNSGDAYFSSDPPEPNIYVWRDGETTAILPKPDAERDRELTDVTPEGRILGAEIPFGPGASRQHGVFRHDGTFIPFRDEVVTRCFALSDGGHVVCEGPGFDYPFLTTVDRLLTAPSSARTHEVTDLRIGHASDTWVRLLWTEVDDGTGAPASYRVKYAAPPLDDWKNAAIGCERWIRGVAVGEGIRCTVEGLEPETDYAFQLMSFRMEDGKWAGARYSNTATATTLKRRTEPVTDLTVQSVTDETVTLVWTQVDDGTGQPALYRVRYGPTPMDPWRSGTIGCDPTLRGDAIGAEIGCTIEGLEPDVPYDVQLMSFRFEDGKWAGARYSNLVTVRGEDGQPVIVTQPSSVTVEGGEVARFAVEASGTPPLSYQWLRNGIELPDATDPEYTTEPTQRADSASVYSVRVSNEVGSVTSTGATLEVVGIAVGGLTGARPLLDPSWSDLVGARYNVRVLENSSALKIIFGASRYYTPGSAITYLTEANVYSGGQSYDDGACTGFPPAGTFVPNQAGLRLGIPDYNYHFGIQPAIGTGIATSSSTEWPVQTLLVDGIQDLYKSIAMSQFDILGRDISVTILRGEVLASAVSYARCELPQLEEPYRRWTATIEGEGFSPVTIEFVMPEAHARYLTQNEPLNFFSEFLHTDGAFRVQYWDLAVMRESTGQWYDLRRFESGRYDGNGHDFGFRVVEVGGTPRIEFANEPGLTYALGGEVIEF